VLDHGCSGAGFKAHDRHIVRTAVRRNPTEKAHDFIGAVFKRDGFPVREVNKDFEALGG
jgi:hypothetical protein